MLVCHPRPLKGSIIARETDYRCERQCPESAVHNIIPSGLCNSRQIKQLHASKKRAREGHQPARASYPASDYTIRIMLRKLPYQGAKVLPPNSRARRRQERAWRQWPGCTRPFASPAPGSTIGAPISPIVPLRCNPARAASSLDRHLPPEPQCSASILPPYAPQARVGPVPNTSCAGKRPRKCLCLFLQGRV